VRQVADARDRRPVEAVREVVSHMVDRLNEPESRFHASLVTNVVDLAEILPRLNVNGDAGLEPLRGANQAAAVQPTPRRTSRSTISCVSRPRPTLPTSSRKWTVCACVIVRRQLLQTPGKPQPSRASLPICPRTWRRPRPHEISNASGASHPEGPHRTVAGSSLLRLTPISSQGTGVPLHRDDGHRWACRSITTPSSLTR